MKVECEVLAVSVWRSHGKRKCGASGFVEVYTVCGSPVWVVLYRQTATQSLVGCNNSVIVGNNNWLIIV
jgi:hypothetical protein